MSYSELLYTVADRVATITFNRPERNNAWTPTMELELREAIAAATADSEARAIVLTGAGKSFCVGADRDALRAVSQGAAPRAKPITGLGDFEQQYSYLLACPKPLIAAINGPAAGVGFCLLLYCDVRFIRSGARISSAFARIGLAAEHGSAWLLPRQIGTMNALDLLLSGRSVDAEEATTLGLARELGEADFAPTVQKYASDIANLCSPVALAVIKRQVYDAWTQGLGDAIRAGDLANVACRASEDFKEGVAHLVERRRANFPGR